MNTWEIDQAAARYRNHPVLGPATKLLADLRDVANRCSDGWCYWPKPARAAKQLMLLIKDGPETATEAKLKKAIAPIKVLFTRHAKDLKGHTLTFPTFG